MGIWDIYGMKHVETPTLRYTQGLHLGLALGAAFLLALIHDADLGGTSLQ